MLFVSVLLIAASTLFKTRGNDIWWHIRTGQWICEHGTLPTTDPFSHTFHGAPWYNVDWIAQLFFFWLHRAGGSDALVWAKAAVVLVTMLVVVSCLGNRQPDHALDRRHGQGPVILVLCIAAVAMHFRLVVKPSLFSLLAFTVVFVLIRSVQARGDMWRLLSIPAIVLLWANLHRGAPLALALCLAAIAAFAVRKERRSQAGFMLVAGILSLGALLVNPTGTYILASVFRESITQVQTTADWAPLSLDLPWLSVPFFLGMSSAWILGLLLHRRRLDFETFTVLGCAVLSFKAIRFVPFAVVAMLPGLVEDGCALSRRVVARLSGYARSRVWHALLAVIGWSVLCQAYLVTYPHGTRGPGMARWLLPVDAASFVKNHPPPGKMWNPLDLGGYLLFALAPDIKVFVDGRSDTLYPRPFFMESLEAQRNPAVLSRQLERHDIGFAVLDVRGPRQAFHRAFYGHPDWVLVYWDDLCAVMVRRTADSEKYLRRFGYRELRIDSALDRLMQWQSDPHRAELARDVLVNLERAPRSIWAHTLAMLVFRASGDAPAYQEQRKIIIHLARERGLQLDLPP